MTAPHGTRSRYNSRSEPCRCDECTTAHRRYAAQRRAARQRDRDRYRLHTDALMVTCWCEENYVLVPPSEILAGRTVSCGSRRCDAAAEGMAS